MNHHKHSEHQVQAPAMAPKATPLVRLESSDAAFTPTPDEVARRAYFTYVNQGSPDGREVQHWLQAEAELIAERNLTRVHGFHNRT